jgi:hypothetical protein
MLPCGLEFLSCGSNDIVKLDNLPNTLKILSIDNSPNIADIFIFNGNNYKLSKLKIISTIPSDLECLCICDCSNLELIGLIPNKIQCINLKNNNMLKKITWENDNSNLYWINISNDTMENSNCFTKFFDILYLKNNSANKTTIKLQKISFLNCISYYWNDIFRHTLKKYFTNDKYYNGALKIKIFVETIFITGYFNLIHNNKITTITKSMYKIRFIVCYLMFHLILMMSVIWIILIAKIKTFL